MGLGSMVAVRRRLAEATRRPGIGCMLACLVWEEEKMAVFMSIPMILNSSLSRVSACVLIGGPA